MTIGKSPQSYTVIQIDPDPFYQINVDLILSGVGMKLHATASTAKELNEMLDQIKRGTLRPDIAIVSNFFSHSWADGADIVARLKQFAPAIKIIGYSVVRDEKPLWADAYAIKSGLDGSHTIVKAMSELLGMEIQVEQTEDNTEGF